MVAVGVLSFDVIERLHEVNVPTLIIWVGKTRSLT